MTDEIVGTAVSYQEGSKTRLILNTPTGASAHLVIHAVESPNTASQLPRDPDVAKLTHAAQNGDPSAQMTLGMLYEAGHVVLQSYDTAVKWYSRVGDNLPPLLQNNLGRIFSLGLGGVPRDLARAVDYYRKAASAGASIAQDNLGYMYEMGDGVAQDYAEAAIWYEKAALQGNSTAQTHLGCLYLEGKGVPQDKAKAASWFQKAALQGDADSQTNLGQMYLVGLGVPQNSTEARKWLQSAADQGNQLAAKTLENLVPRKSLLKAAFRFFTFRR